MENIYSFLGSFILSNSNYLTHIISAIITLFVGIYVSKLAKNAIVKIAVATKINSLSKNPAIEDFLNNAQVGTKVETVLGEVVRWLVLFLFIIVSSNILGLNAVSNLLIGVFDLIPNILSALITLIIGVILAGFLEKLVKGSLGSHDPSLSRFAGRVVSYTTITIFILSSMSQLGIASFFIQVTYIGFILVLALALGLGIGLGSKDIFKQILENWYKKVNK